MEAETKNEKLTPSLDLVGGAKDVGVVFSAKGSFPEALDLLVSNGLKPIGLRDLVYAEMNGDHNISSFISLRGGYVKEGVIYSLAKNKLVLTRNSPTFEYSKDFVKLLNDRLYEGEGFILTPRLANDYLDRLSDENDSEVIEVNHKDTEIPVKKFVDSEIANWLFQDQTKAYGEFLHNAGLKTLDLDTYHKQERNNSRPFARNFWNFHGADGVYLTLHAVDTDYSSYDGVPILGLKDTSVLE